jgi:hypothetical protein
VKVSSVRVLVALVKAKRKHAAALENVAEFLKKRSNQMLSSPQPNKRWKKPERS